MYNSETNHVPSGEMSLLKGIVAQANPAFNPDKGNRTQLPDAEKFAVQANPAFRDKKLDNVAGAVVAEVYDFAKDTTEVTKRRQDKICEAIAIMRMAASESTWLRMRPDKSTENESKEGSKTRAQIIDTVCKTVLGESIPKEDFDHLYGSSFADMPNGYEQHYQKEMSAERRILLIKAAEQFLAYADDEKNKNDKTAQERASTALAAIDRVASGQLNPDLDKNHAKHARTEAASLLAGRDIIKHRPALEAYFSEKSIGQADKLRVVMDLELKTLGQTQELARMIKKLTENGISPKLQFALVSKIEEGLEKPITDEDVWSTRNNLRPDLRSKEDFIRQEKDQAKEKILKNISFNLLGAKYTSDQAAIQALLVMSRAFAFKPAFALAEHIEAQRHDESRGTNMADLSPAVIKVIPSFLLEKQSLSTFEKSQETGPSASLIALGFEPKKRMDQEQVKLAITLIMQGLGEIAYSSNFSTNQEKQEKLAVYLEMLVSVKQKLPKNQREDISFSSDMLSAAIAQGRLYEPKVGARIMKANQRLKTY